jgi:hypothetical protein
MKYACVAATEDRARCRNWMKENNPTHLCGFHQSRQDAGQEVKRISQPDVIEYKFNLNKTWACRLRELGVSFKEQDFAAKEAKHIAHAEEYGRDPFRFREGVSDSGVPVFGEEGLVKVSVYELLQELVRFYEVVDIFIRPRRDGTRHMEVLVVRFFNGKECETNTQAFQQLLSFLASSCWGHCHIWANPPRGDGLIIDTVNSAHREEGQKPQQIVRFTGGLWATELIEEVVGQK